VDSIGEVIFSGPLLLALPLALLAGLVAFASPCVLPLVPGYLGYVSGFSSTTELAAKPKTRVVVGVLLFIAGFSTVFIGFSVAFASLGFLQRQTKLPLASANGYLGAPLLGVVFGLGWAPCIGPTLIAVNTLALSAGDIPRAVALAIAYCIGLGVPFILIALGFGWVTGAVGWLKKHMRAINIAGGVILMAIGTAMVTGVWQFWMSNLQAVISGTTTPL